MNVRKLLQKVSRKKNFPRESQEIWEEKFCGNPVSRKTHAEIIKASDDQLCCKYLKEIQQKINAKFVKTKQTRHTWHRSKSAHFLLFNFSFEQFRWISNVVFTKKNHPFWFMFNNLTRVLLFFLQFTDYKGR